MPATARIKNDVIQIRASAETKALFNASFHVCPDPLEAAAKILALLNQARDRLGIKPLYYAPAAEALFTLASKLQLPRSMSAIDPAKSSVENAAQPSSLPVATSPAHNRSPDRSPASAEPMSPFLTLSPPPAPKWQRPQVARVGLPTLLAAAAMSTVVSGPPPVVLCFL